MNSPNNLFPQKSTFYGATAEELKQKREAVGWRAWFDQRLLFPHHGEVILESRKLILNSWLTLNPEEITNLRLEFTPLYPRSLAGGVRGQFPSLGIFSAGRPLILETVPVGEIYLLIGYKWLWGTTQNAKWLTMLSNWLIASHRNP